MKTDKRAHNGIWIYQFKLTDGSAGIWRTRVDPENSKKELAKRFLGREVVEIT